MDVLRLFVATVALATLSLSPCASLARKATPPGSFLRYRASTVQELLAQVSADEAVRNRYARHFGISPNQVRAALGDGLRLTSLSKSTRVQSWYVGKRGRLHVKPRLLPKGTLVYVGADGKPLLAWSCGNPLRTDIPRRTAKQPNTITQPTVGQTTSTASANAGAAPAPQSSEASAVAVTPDGEPPVETKVLPGPVETVGTEPLSAVPGFVEAAEPVVVAQAPAAPEAVVTGGYAPAVATGGMGLSSIAGIAGALAGLAALAVRDNSPPPTPPVPEPTGLVVVVMGALAAAGAKRRRR
jgi:hypothetical protein